MTPKICVFAKPPRAGLVKTRLAAELGETRAAELAAAFLRDTWSFVTGVPWAEAVLATSEPHAREWVFLPNERVEPQGDGTLGERIERVLRRALAAAPFAIALGADTPGLPPSFLALARARLEVSRAVIGPCDDGGFYLLGLCGCPEGLLEGVPWSSAETYAATLERLRAFGLEPALLPTWFDVDTPADLERLRELLASGRANAPHTARVLGIRTSVAC